MVNILIADDNVDYAITLMNYINEKNDNIRVCNIAKDGKETINILNTDNNIDVILLDYKMPFYNGNQVVNKIINELFYLNYDISQRGTQYLVSTIEYICLNNDYINNLEKYVYPIIAKFYNATPNNVKCRIHKKN